VQRTSFQDVNCSVAQCLEVVGEWWSLLIVRDALFGVSRFDDFQSRLGISRNVLNQRLTHLVDHGVLEKVAYQDHPPRYDYRPTAKGVELWRVVDAMRQWGDRWAAPDGPRIEMVHRSCGHRADVVPTCPVCGEVVEGPDVQPVLGPGATNPDFLPTRD
jgi:DNA-binding HxlR family transcriptional regulator